VPPDRAPSLLAVLATVALMLYPLGIPTSWTAQNIAEKRQQALDQAEAPG
jgi:phosphatidylglycerol:prolipoprotein diacylglycerol transferase